MPATLEQQKVLYPNHIELTNEQKEIIELKNIVRVLQTRVENLELRLAYSDRR